MGLFNSIGGIVNDILGGTTSAKQAQNYAMQQQAAQNVFNKETMQNLHQWEVEDLKKAGLNPALGYGGNTTGIATGTASGPQAATGNPIEMISTAVGIGNQLKEMELTSASKTKTEAETDLLDAQTAKQIAENPYIDTKTKAEISNMEANTKYTNERARGFTESESTSESSGWGGSTGIKIGKKEIGPQGSINRNTAKSVSKSRTW